MSFEEVWSKIEKHAGETFHTKDGVEFTYKIEGDLFIAAEGDQTILKSDFQRAYRMIPQVLPEEIEKIVKGPAYVWSVLNDERISEG